MPEGNHHHTPHGLWYQEPTPSSVPRLFAKTAGKIGGLLTFYYLFNQFRSIQWTYTYTSFIGKTMSFGKISTFTHEPLSVEEIDRLKAAEAEKKKKSRGS